MNALFDRVTALLNEKLSVDPAAVHPDATWDELDVDSLDMVEFMLVLEDDLGVRVTDEEAGELRTVGDAVALLEAKGARVAV